MNDEAERIAALVEYGEYLRFCVANPKLANGRVVPVDVWDKGTADDSQYLWFVAYSLYVFGRVFEATRGEGYSSTLQSMIVYHKEALNICWEKHWKNEHAERFVNLVEEVIGSSNA